MKHNLNRKRFEYNDKCPCCMMNQIKLETTREELQQLSVGDDIIVVDGKVYVNRDKILGIE